MLDALFFALFFVLNYLRVHSYPVLTIEALALGLGLFAPTALFYTGSSKFKIHWVFYGALFLLAADLGFGALAVLKKTGGLFLAAAAVFLWFGFAFLLRKKIGSLFRAWAGTMALAALLLFIFFPEPLYAIHEIPGSFAPNGKPNVYFFLLDEHQGFKGWPEKPEFESLKNEIKDIYLKKGFFVYEDASSNFCATFDSIPSFLNVEIPSHARQWLKGKSLQKNRLFEKWRNERYRLQVYQSSHLDYCHAPNAAVGKCFVYKESSAGYIKDRLSPIEKFWVLLNNFVEEHKSRPLIRVFRHFSRRVDTGQFMTGALAADRVFEEMERDTRTHPEGTVFFAHLLLPHSSYVFDENGGVLSPFLWESASGEPLDDNGHLNTSASRARKYALYARQVKYTHRVLGRFLDALGKDGQLEKSSFFIASDHGSRIFLTTPAEQFAGNLAPSDLTDAFSAFLITKKPGGQGAFHPEPASVLRMLAEFFDLPGPTHDQKKYFQTSAGSPPKEIALVRPE